MIQWPDVLNISIGSRQLNKVANYFSVLFGLAVLLLFLGCLTLKVLRHTIPHRLCRCEVKGVQYSLHCAQVLKAALFILSIR